MKKTVFALLVIVLLASCNNSNDSGENRGVTNGYLRLNGSTLEIHTGFPPASDYTGTWDKAVIIENGVTVDSSTIGTDGHFEF
jgi:hypothetical protein